MKQIDKILVIEDETDIRNTLKDILEFEGYEVLLAANGKIGYNLICLDYVLESNCFNRLIKTLKIR